MGLPENCCYLYPNKFHKSGDKQPCLTANKIVIGGLEFKMAIWPPKQGKQAYFMRIDPVTSVDRTDGEESTHERTQQSREPISTPQNIETNPSSLFK